MLFLLPRVFSLIVFRVVNKRNIRGGFFFIDILFLQTFTFFSRFQVYKNTRLWSFRVLSLFDLERYENPKNKKYQNTFAHSSFASGR
jgi:hypothetical protein